MLHRYGAQVEISQVVFIESINGKNSTKHMKHTSRNLQPTDYRRYSYGTTYSLRRIKTREGNTSAKKKAVRQTDIFPAGNRIVFRFWHTTTAKVAFDPAGHHLLHVTQLLPTGMAHNTNEHGGCTDIFPTSDVHSSSPSSPFASLPPGPSKSSTSL